VAALEGRRPIAALSKSLCRRDPLRATRNPAVFTAINLVHTQRSPQLSRENFVQGERSEPTSRSFSFGPFTLVPDRLLLLRDNVPVRIGGRAIDILQVLVEQAGTVVSKRELMARVWPKAVVDDSNLKVNVAVLRRALEDGGPGDPRYIATVVGRGYRFIAPLTVGDPSDIAVTPTVSSARRHNMPTATTRLIGRADVISAIQHDLQLSRLVTIVGAGGIGKTTVALAVAERAMDSFQDGVWFVDLSHFKDPTLVPAAVATAVGVSAHSHDLLAALCTSLQDREMLLLLDSCEHVIEAAAACATQILTRAADVKILVTSREPLLTQGERVRRLPGLAIPNTTSNLTADEALAYPAIQLFVSGPPMVWNLLNSATPTRRQLLKSVVGSTVWHSPSNLPPRASAHLESTDCSNSSTTDSGCWWGVAPVRSVIAQ